MIVAKAPATGEPGICFIDRVNEDSPTPELGRIEATNPCREMPLLPNEGCNLGAINLTAFVDEDAGDMDWDSLRKAVELSVRFLDDVIDLTHSPGLFMVSVGPPVGFGASPGTVFCVPDSRNGHRRPPFPQEKAGLSEGHVRAWALRRCEAIASQTWYSQWKCGQRAGIVTRIRRADWVTSPPTLMGMLRQVAM